MVRLKTRRHPATPEDNISMSTPLLQTVHSDCSRSVWTCGTQLRIFFSLMVDLGALEKRIRYILIMLSFGGDRPNNVARASIGSNL